MPYTLKPFKIHAKDSSTGEYLPQNVITDESTEEAIDRIEQKRILEESNLSTRANEIMEELDESYGSLSGLPQTVNTLISDLIAYGSIDIGFSFFQNKSSSPYTYQGITYTWDSGNKWHVSGTATATSFRRIYFEEDSTGDGSHVSHKPEEIISGNTYWIKVKTTDSGIGLNVYLYRNDTTLNYVSYRFTDGEWYMEVPSDCTGCQMRIQVASGSVVNGDIEITLLTSRAYTEQYEYEAALLSRIVDLESRVTVLENDPWKAVFAAEEDGTYTEKYQIGDTIPLDLGPEGIINMEIVAFDADVLSSSPEGASTPETAKITWIAKEILNTSHIMNPNYSEGDDSTGTIGGWGSSNMRNYLQTTIRAGIPTEVRSRIKEVVKYSFSFSPSDSDSVSNDTIWIPSTREIFGTKETMGPTYSSYSSAADRIKTKANSSSACVWFTRSAYNSVRSYVTVGTDGIAHTDNTHISNGVVIGFCT